MHVECVGMSNTKTLSSMRLTLVLLAPLGVSGVADIVD